MKGVTSKLKKSFGHTKHIKIVLGTLLKPDQYIIFKRIGTCVKLRTLFTLPFIITHGRL